MFDAIAGRYDFLNHLLSAGIDRHWRSRAIRALALSGGERMLDLCTGTADLAIAGRSSRPAPSRIIGIDFATEMLRVGQAKIAGRRMNDAISLVRGDATRVPVADRSIDAVTMAFGIRNVEDPRAACQEIHRVLASGGRLAILEFAVPTIPLVRSVYLAYFRWVLPVVGRLISRHRAAYGYLPASVSAFDSPREFVEALRRAGFADIRADALTLGIVYLYTARKA
jgi:demethylmenaquinone methyltransferase/2-methoxy-6-polyprenyl-1,4-benzoquinol methylase